MTESDKDFDPTTDMTRDEAWRAAQQWAKDQNNQIRNPVKKGGAPLPQRKKK